MIHLSATEQDAPKSLRLLDHHKLIGRMTLEEVDAALAECEEVIKDSDAALAAKALKIRVEDPYGPCRTWSPAKLAVYAFHGNLHPMLRDYKAGHKDAWTAWDRLVGARRKAIKLIRRRLTLLSESADPTGSKVREMIKVFRMVN